MAIYRKAWTSPTTGWQHRLDIVPYGETLSGSVTTLTPAEGMFIEVGAVEVGFDDLPYGLAKAAVCKIGVVLSELPSALQTIIRTKVAGTTRTLFMLFSDRGTSGATFTLEFSGVQQKISGTKYKVKGSTFITELELIDAMQWVMASTSMDTILGQPTFPAVTTTHGVLYDVGFSGATRADSYHDARVSATGWSDKYKAVAWETVMSAVRLGLTQAWTAKAARTSNGTSAALDTAADSALQLDTGFFNCATFYKASTTYPRAVSTALTKTTTLLVTNVLQSGTGDTIGGITSASDKYSWATYKTAWDWMLDMAETFNAKVWHVTNYNAGGGNPYLTVTWYMRPAKANYDASTPVAINIDRSIAEEFEVVETEVGIGSSQVRLETESGNDVKEFRNVSGTTRADRSYTVRCKMTNSVSVKSDYDFAVDDRTKADHVSKGLFQTNLLCYADGSAIVKAHEAVRLFTDASTSTLYEPATSATPPNPTADANAPNAWNLWVNAVQSEGGLPNALSQHILAMFAQDNLASVEAEYMITTNGSATLPTALGSIHNITGALATGLPHLSWSTAIVTNVSTDFVAGTTSIKYTLCP